MKKKEYTVILEAQLPRSYQPDDANERDGQQESLNAATQPESSKTATHQAQSKPTTHSGSCASPEYEALFVEWPFKAPSRGQTSMPASITKLISNLPTREERIIAKQLWNPSLPVSANVGIIEYNRVDGVKFKEKVDEKYGEGWWRRLEDLARELNEAARVVVGKGRGIAVVQGEGNGGKGVALDEGSRKGKAPEKKAIELPKGQGGEFKNKYINETEGKDQEHRVKTLDHLAEAAALVAKTGDGSNTKIAEFTTEGEEAKPNSDEKATEAAMSLFTLSSTPADTPTAEPSAEPSALAATNPLSALWYLIDRFFSSGPSAASYFFVALEAAIRLDTTTVHPLNIPAPPAFWTDAVPWDMPKVGLTLILTLASSSNNKFDAFARFSKSLGKPPSSVSEMRTKPSASLRKAVLRAKDDAARKARTTILGVDLRDVFYSQLCEVHGRDIEQHFATFGRMFALGISPGGGAKLWLVGGEWGETGTVWEGNRKVGAGVGTWEEMDEFVRAFEGFAVADGQWNTKRFKWYHRCFAVDLKQFDLQIDDEEKQKRGMSSKEEGTKRLLNEIEAWVEIYRVEDVRGEDVGKFAWL